MDEIFCEALKAREYSSEEMLLFVALEKDGKFLWWISSDDLLLIFTSFLLMPFSCSIFDFFGGSIVLSSSSKKYQKY